MKLLYLFIVGIIASASNIVSDGFEFVQGDKKTSLTNIHDGDIIFQTSSGELSKAIQLATHSEYSHCGIIFYDNGKPYVYEAVQPVTKTSLHDWINRGVKHSYVIKRFSKDGVLTSDAVAKMKKNCSTFLGKDYDIFFGWNDERIYCSELVWKVYKNVLNVEVGKVQELKDFDLTHPLVKQKLKEHYGSNIPYSEKVISPQAIFESTLLKEVN